jgi:transposase
MASRATPGHKSPIGQALPNRVSHQVRLSS